ncbi:hypothetical protein HEP85_29885 [Streptomyces sp. RPA4-2]|uniref:hypothetical protein n=1 Tax=Streptomyces sp. RPA4-2 TaxID=2721244 RepID=UPI00143E9B87|nr:hypothetical protein [Streptomyces sp. RPA4-2]QIY60380.1 hypothetical protein HEP85_29885 [Streptomyces sp. RPA4-2]
MASTMRITIDDDRTATVTGAPLRLAPRFDFRDFHVRVAQYANVEERGGFLLDTFGSGPWLWNTPDEVRRRDPAALARLRRLDHSLRSQHEDRHRADALLSLIGELVEDYGNG